MRVRGSLRARSFGLLATSSAAHLVIFSSLGLIPSPAEVLARHEMEFEVVEPPKKEEPPPPPPPEPEPPKEKPKEVTRAAPKAEPEPPPEAPPPPTDTAAEEVADFTGVTLTAEGGGGWSTAVGSGGAFKGPIGKIGRGENGPQQAAKSAPAGPRVVPLNSLSRKPAPPTGMDDLLRKHYPARARMQGVEGQAIVQFRVLPSGRIAGEIRVREEFPPGFGFGAGCQDMLREATSWTPGLDAQGNPVATDIPKYVCRFVVDD